MVGLDKQIKESRPDTTKKRESLEQGHFKKILSPKTSEPESLLDVEYAMMMQTKNREW